MVFQLITEGVFVMSKKKEVNPLIEVKNLQFFFGEGSLKFEVLKKIDLSVMPGEVIILTGPSGSGKTTLLTILGGLRKIENGSVKILGSDLFNASEDDRVKIRKNIGFIFQQHNLLKSLTAKENVLMSLELDYNNNQLEREKVAKDILSSVGLGDRMDFLPSSLSGGQKQRVSIARALSRKPKLILADEPTASLDKQSGKEAVNLLRDLAKKQGSAILLVTHDNRILDIADRIISFEDGKILNS
jgi:putative ABC transport system ATP-binding protein